MPQLGFQELLVILLIVLLVFGAKRLPEMGAAIGKGIREFKKSMKDVQSSIDSPQERDELPPAQSRHIDQPVQRSGDPKKLSQ
jgi:sec-independent protein translocase protein TatA